VFLMESARGRWPQILASLGIEERFLKKKNGPCPSCGGKDRYRFTDYNGDGMFWCNNCGPGNGLQLLELQHGWDRKDSIREVVKVIGADTVKTAKPWRSDGMNAESAAKRLNSMREKSVKATESPCVVEYLRSRGLKVPCSLRALHGVKHYREDGSPSAGVYDVMLALFSTHDGLPATYHRTFLKDGRKADVDKPKKFCGRARDLSGGAVRLYPAGETLGVAEGVETAIAAHQLFNLPVWATCGTTLMAKFKPPECVKRLVIFGDNDSNYAGQVAAYTLASKMIVLNLAVDVRFPAPPAHDFADFQLASRRK